MALPRGTTGSLWPTFVSARAVTLAVRRAYAIALNSRCPTGLLVAIRRQVNALAGWLKATGEMVLATAAKHWPWIKFFISIGSCIALYRIVCPPLSSIPLVDELHHGLFLDSDEPVLHAHKCDGCGIVGTHKHGQLKYPRLDGKTPCTFTAASEWH